MRRGTRFTVLALASTLSGCVWGDVQRWPGPMQSASDTLGPGDSALHPAGPEEVAVIRHADPVQVRPAGAKAGHPLEFYTKRSSLTAGGAVIVSPGGRAEILWPSGTSIVLFGDSVGWVGSPSRGEPIFELQKVDRARLDLQQGDQVRLLGGSVLTGSSGPYVLEHLSDETLSVHNQSKGSVQVAFREEVFELAPGQAVRVPLLSSGGTPFVDDPALQRFNGERFAVRLLGELDCSEDPAGIRVRAAGGGAAGREVRGLGVRVLLDDGDSVLFSDPWRGTSAPAPEPAPAPPAESASAQP